MKYEEIQKALRYDYTEECKCGKSYTILTQRCNFPEYESYVYLKCECGEFVEFILPVN